MRMVKCSAVGSGLESVRETPTGRHWAHRDTRNAIRPFCVLLVEAVPMHGGTFGRPTDGIVHSDLDGVAPVGFDQGLEMHHWRLSSSKQQKAYPWILAVDQEHILLISVRTDCSPGYRKLIRASDASVSSTCVWI